MRCPRHDGLVFDEEAALIVHLLDHLIALEDQVTYLGVQMSEFITDQAHMDADIQSLSDGFASLETVIAGLKSQPGAEALDFTAADALVASVQVAVNPPAPVDGSDTPIGDGAAADTTPVDPTVPVGDGSTPIGDGVPVDDGTTPAV